MRKFMTVLAALALSGCVGSMSDVGPYPQDYKEIVAEDIHASFNDPYTLRDVSISHPARGHLGFTYGWVVCVLANGKNAFGGYAGAQFYSVVIRDGAVIVSTDGEGLACDGQPYDAWPEMEMGRAFLP